MKLTRPSNKKKVTHRDNLTLSQKQWKKKVKVYNQGKVPNKRTKPLKAIKVPSKIQLILINEKL